jgi:flavorubredoxin
MPASWIPSHLHGVLAVSCYVLRDGTESLVIDTGLAIHRDQITSGLAAVLQDTTRRALIMTRREPDAIINLPWLVKRFGMSPVYCGGPLSPLDFFERVDQQNTQAHIKATANSDIEWLRLGTNLAIGRLTLDVLRTKFCVLPKNHFYEHETRTLFGSDSWGFLSQEPGTPLAVVSRIDSRLSRENIAKYLRHKFDWLIGIDTKPIVDDLLELAATYDIKRICPSYGGIIEGRETVRYLFDETIEALKMLAREPMVDRLRGFDKLVFERALA